MSTISQRRAAARALIGLAGKPGEGVLDELKAARLSDVAAEEREAASHSTPSASGIRHVP